jgi:hypothetical protein
MMNGDAYGKALRISDWLPCRRPPTITAPASRTLNATSQSGTPYTIPPEVAQTCPGAPPCTVAVYINNVKYSIGSNVTLATGATDVVYTITNAAGQSANSTCTVTVLPPLYVQ